MNLSKVSLSKFFISLLALVVLVYIFDLTANLPIPYIHQITTSTILIIQVLFLATYSIVSIKNKRINKIFLILLPVTLMPFISAFCSTLNFNQPFFYGFLSERTKFDFVLGIILIVALERNFITIQLLKKLLYRLAFFYFLICLFFYLVIDPNLFEGSDFVIFSSSKGFIYRFNLSLIVFLFFYSYCEIIFSDKISIKSILYSVATLSFLIFIAKARSLTAAVVVCSFGFGLLNTTFRKKLILYSIGIIIAFLLFSAIFLIFPEELSSISALFVSAFNVFIGGEVADMSAASRITQLNIGKEGFLNSPIFGNGTLSSQWNLSLIHI